MTEFEMIADSCAGNLPLVRMLLSDFSDADMFVRPVPGANHTAWQLGHLINSEAEMVNAVKEGAVPRLPKGFAEKFTKETATVDDPEAFPSKAVLLDHLTTVRVSACNWIRSLNREDASRPTPDWMKGFARTHGHLAMFLPQHLAMHLGQIQVVRRKLGKPVLF